MDAQASVLFLKGAAPQAIATLLQAVSLLENSGESRSHMYTDLLSHISALYHDAGDTKKSFHYNSLELAALESNGQLNTQAALSAQHNIATALLNFGEVAGAFEQEKQTVARARSATSDGTIQPMIWDLYGNLQLRLNAPLAAVASYDDGIAAARRHKDVESEMYGHVGRADALIDAGRLDEVRTELTVLADFAKGREVQFRRPLKRAAIVEAKLLLAQSRLNDARRHIDGILEDLRATSTGGMGYLALALSLSTRIALAEHRFGDAERIATEALALFNERARNPAASADVGESLLLLAQAQLGLGRPTDAAETARRAVTSLKAGLGPGHPFTLEAATLPGID